MLLTTLICHGLVMEKNDADPAAFIPRYIDTAASVNHYLRLCNFVHSSAPVNPSSYRAYLLDLTRHVREHHPPISSEPPVS